MQYLGAHERFQPECDLAYNNQLMVLLWSSLATRDAAAGPGRARPDAAGSAVDGLGHLPALPRRHRLGRLGRGRVRRAASTRVAHRAFLSDFYAGEHPGSFARGAVFQANPRTGDRRISGSAASLCGLEAALAAGDAVQTDAAVARLLMLYSVVYSYGGIPLLYMGDELALRNDPRWADDPAHADDNRWLHRPPMDWAAADRRTDAGTVEGTVFAGLAEMARVRAGQLALRAGDRAELLDAGDDRVLGYVRRHPRGARLVALAAFSDDAGRGAAPPRPAGVRRRRPRRARQPRRPGRRAQPCTCPRGATPGSSRTEARSPVRREPRPTAAVPSSGVRRVGSAP